MEIKLKTKCIKDPSFFLDYVPIVGSIRMKSFATERKMMRKMECFGWHFSNFSSEYESTTITDYGNTAVARDNYSHWMTFVRPNVHVGNAFFKIVEWLFLKTLGLYKLAKWLWLVLLIVGGIMLESNPGFGVALMCIPLAILAFSNILCLVGKALNKKVQQQTEEIVEMEGYKPSWGMTEKEFKAFNKSR